ncbi:MAG: CPBP family intramembrane metalloprotease [Anaerolineae bacterium]|nr:CPBP family intramembrane metalloprotease [Anaerolineae bacterium]
MTWRARMADGLRTAARTPAVWVFGVLWLASVVVLIAGGHIGLGDLAFPVGYLALTGITVLVTPGATDPQPTSPRRWLMPQLVVVAVFIVITLIDGLVFHQVVTSGVPIWNEFRIALERAGGQLLGNDNYILNPVAYFVVPLLILLALKARPRELGLRLGHYSRRVTLLWCVIPVAILAALVASGQMTLTRLVNRLISNALQNGFFEEFLFRGALQSRLRGWFSPAWALVIQALVFGLWHFGLGMSSTGGDPLAAAASTILYQGTMGLAFGVMFARTGSLIAGSISHVVLNSIG